MKLLRAIAAAFSYFSILPVPSFSAVPGAAAIGWLPLVGLAIGAAAGFAALGIFALTTAPLWAIAVAFVASLVFSGAIHVDGFLDCADALLMTAPPRRRLEVLHDPRHGSYAVVAMAILAVVWIVALAQLTPHQMPAALAFAALVSRAAVIPLAQIYPHARSGIRLRGTASYGVAWFAAASIASALLLHAWTPVLLIAGAYLLALVLGAFASRRLGGGLTGDVYGAVVVVTEIALLIAAPILPATP